MSRKRKKRRKINYGALLVCVAAVGFFGWFFGTGKQKLILGANEPVAEDPVSETGTAPVYPPAFEQANDGAPAPFENAVSLTEENGVTYLTLDGHTMLYVNKQYSIPEDFGGENAEASAALQGLYDAAAADGLTIYTVSGYRSYSLQKSIYENNIATRGLEYTETISARPGTSEHQTGLAFDVGSGSDTSTVLSSRFANTAEYAWLQQHMADHGFILRYPEGKTEWTGYAFEPWHIRYVGVELAQYIQSTGLSVEELCAQGA